MAQKPPISPDPSKQSRSLLHQVTFSEPFLAAHMCSGGSVYVAPSPNTPNNRSPLTSTTSTSHPTNHNPQSPISLDPNPSLLISSGLGHGLWSDEILPSLLNPSDNSTEKTTNLAPPHAMWYASPHGFQHDCSDCEFEWPGLPETQKPDKAAIMVRYENGELIALYRPRGEGLSPMGGDEEGRCGRLGVCVDLGVAEGDTWRRENVVRHLLMVAVGIEEQIRRSRGFQGVYHGRWAR
ncbi:MAG: hypothetical protein Q9160_007612 [Pyrenula sp. 1 TL-2023]